MPKQHSDQMLPPRLADFIVQLAMQSLATLAHREAESLGAPFEPASASRDRICWTTRRASESRPSTRCSSPTKRSLILRHGKRRWQSYTIVPILPASWHILFHACDVTPRRTCQCGPQRPVLWQWTLQAVGQGSAVPPIAPLACSVPPASLDLETLAAPLAIKCRGLPRKGRL